MVGYCIRSFRRLAGFLVVAALLFALGAPLISAQEGRPEGFYDIAELERLLQIARESGFTEKQIKEITVEAEGKVLNAWEYLQEQKRKRRLAEEQARERAKKKYLTVQDVFADLEKKDAQDLRKLRDETIFVE